MALMMVEVYDALIDAGASEEKARKAATEIAAYDNRLASVARKLDHITIELRLYAVLLTTIGLGILWRVWH